MQRAVREIVEGIESGVHFDSHFIIDTVIRDFSDVYLTFAADNRAKAKVTEVGHSEIAKTISTLDGTLVERVSGKSLSYNIRGKASNCALWRKA